MNKVMLNIPIRVQAVFMVIIFMSSCSSTSEAPKVGQVMQIAGVNKMRPPVAGRVLLRNIEIDNFLKSVDVFARKHKFEKRGYPDASTLLSREVSFFSLRDKKNVNSKIPAFVFIDFEEIWAFRIELYSQGFTNQEASEVCLTDIQKMLLDNNLKFVPSE